jgi:hypothetical protein
MVVTVPVGRRTRFTVSWSRTAGLWAVKWRPRPCGDAPEGDGWDTGGVREPRVPRLPRLGGAIALPLDDERL